MRGIFRHSLVLTTLLAAAACQQDDTQLGEDEQEVIVGSLAARFDDTLRGGGVVAQGASLSGREDAVANTTATITIAGIPAGATVQRALLYWWISGGTDTTATIGAANVTGVLLGTAGDTCWGVNNSAFRADVTAQVTGNGNYVIGGLPSSTTATSPDTDGAALVVVYQNLNSGTRRRVMIRDGAITSSGSGEVVSDTFAGVAAPLASAGQFHMVVGDGQTFADGNVTFNGTVVGTDQFRGSDGALWDVNTYNVTVPLNLASATWSSATNGDCLGYSTAVLDWNVGVCGDGVRTGGEVCDQGNTTNGDGCSSVCLVETGWNCTAANPSVCTPICGDGIRVGTEQCDQGNTTNGDGCSSTCTIEPGWSCSAANPSVCTTICGDGIRAGAEQCDQGNTTAGDGCSATCTIEPGWTCTGSPSTCVTTCGDGIRAGTEQCDQGNTTPGDGCSATCTIEPGWMCTGSPSVCTTRCGDGIRAGAEACDDGDMMSGDGCSATCAIEPGWTCTGSAPSVCNTTCGDGIRAGAEACDDGDTMSGDGCSNVCAIEPGWTCTGAPSTCVTTCGDGIPAGAEQCDDGGTTPGDGCSATCTTEPGFTCTGLPSMCVTTCGDGIIAGGETCDDGDAMGGDGCSATCATEPGWTCTGAPSRCVTTCGDGVIAGSETCDDMNTTADDGCSATCVIEPGWSCTGAPSACDEVCGDGLVVGAEACDDGNTTAEDGCSATCTIEMGWSCTGEPSTCMSNCGDGQIIAGQEDCDDGNNADGDGCSAACDIEPGWTCTNAPSDCQTDCGDAMVVGDEACDDGNQVRFDGCSDQCAVEAGWICTDTAPTECDEISVAGGGCSAGGSSGLPVAGALVVLAAALRRRRRGAALLATLVLVGASAAPSAAQVVNGTTGYSGERFRLAMDRNGVLGTESARTPGHLVLDIGLWLGYADDPVTVRFGDDHERLDSLVHTRVGGDLVASVGVGSRLELGLAAPLVLSQSEQVDTVMTNGELASLGFGDLALTPKVSLLKGAFDVGLAAQVTLPTSGAEDYMGEDGVTVTPSLLLGKVTDTVRVLANVGYRLRSMPEGADEPGMGDLPVDDEILARLGFGVRAGKADLMVEGSFATAADKPLDTYNLNHGEVRGGLGFTLTPGLKLFAAGGVGVASGYGTPDWRALGGVWFGAGQAGKETVVEKSVDRDGDGIYDGDDKCVTKPETVNAFEDEDGCPDEAPDADGDGILVPTDQCPAEAENKNGFQDDDGCPDTVPDTDGDGLSDPTDNCPAMAEDKDGFEDDDGCPDDDNDRDGVTDLSDRCPMEAGVVENGGCPDTDRDGDTVVDRLDNCPDEPGTVKNHGCKDKQLVVFTGGSIDLLDIVYFKTNKAEIQKRSFKLLKNVASVVRAHTEIKRITVEGHTDNQGDDDYNKDLSQRRAQAVADFLVANGVDAAILTPIGYGEERPIKDNRTKKGRAANRRVEFKIDGITSAETTNPLLPSIPPTPSGNPSDLK